VKLGAFVSGKGRGPGLEYFFRALLGRKKTKFEMRIGRTGNEKRRGGGGGGGGRIAKLFFSASVHSGQKRGERGVLGRGEWKTKKRGGKGGGFPSPEGGDGKIFFTRPSPGSGGGRATGETKGPGPA